MRFRTRLAATLAALSVAGVLSAAGLSGRGKEVSVGPGFAALPAAPAPALEIGRPTMLIGERYVSRWTIVRRPTIAHAAPTSNSPVVARLTTSVSEGTLNLLAVLSSRSGADGTVWVEARIPGLPNGRRGWVRRRALGPYQVVRTRLVVDRDRLLAILYRNGRAVLSAPVGIGTTAFPTPVGEFNVRSKLTRYASPFYGPVAFGTTAQSAVLTDWPGGGVVGIHGTNQPQLLPGRVSHGCIRLRNEDIVRLARLMPMGTPVTIR